MKENLCKKNNILSENINTEDVYLFKVLVEYFAINCCDGFENTVVITEEIANTDGEGEPYTSAGISISGFEEGGKICYSISTIQDSNQNYAILNSDGDVGGHITANFKITNDKIIYVNPSNECFEVLLEKNPENGVCLLSKIEKISFLDYLQTKINDGTIVDISSKVSNFNVSDFNISDFDFMSTNDVNEKDVELYEVYQAWRLKYNSNLEGTTEPELNDFRNFYDSLIKQNISNTIIVPIKYLPSLESEDFIFKVITGEIIRPKQCTPTPTPLPAPTPTPTPVQPKIWSEVDDTWSTAEMVWGE